MRLAFVGTRSLPALATMQQVAMMLDHRRAVYPDKQYVIVSGGAIGPDQFAEAFARSAGWPVSIHLPDWTKHGKSAGFKRNQRIVEVCDELIALWDGKSAGTAHTIRLALAAQKPVVVGIYNTDLDCFDLMTHDALLDRLQEALHA